MQTSHEDVFVTVQTLSERISRALDVRNRRFTLERVDAPHVASTRLTWPPAPAAIRLSRDCTRPSILGHELTHGLVPTRWVFFAEGFATWMGCEIAGDCSDFFFAEADVDEVIVQAHARGRYTSLQRFIAETTQHREFFAPEGLHRFHVRFAHLCAASFLRWFHRSHPGLPALVGAEGCEAPIAELTRLAGTDVATLEARWLASVGAR